MRLNRPSQTIQEIDFFGAVDLCIADEYRKRLLAICFISRVWSDSLSVSQAESEDEDEPKLASSSPASYSLDIPSLALEFVPREERAVLKEISAEDGEARSSIIESLSSAVSQSCSILCKATAYESLIGVLEEDSAGGSLEGRILTLVEPSVEGGMPTEMSLEWMVSTDARACGVLDATEGLS